MVVASYCETLKFLRNMNFNIPLYDTPSTVLRKLLLNLGINTILSRLRKKVGQSSTYFTTPPAHQAQLPS